MLECKKKKQDSLKVIPLVVWEFGKDPRILCRQWLHKARLWGCQYQCRTPAAKVTALSQITTVDPRNLSWCHQSVDSLKSRALSVYPRVEKWEKRERHWSDQPRRGTEECHRGIATELFVLRCCTSRIRCLLPWTPTLQYSLTKTCLVFQNIWIYLHFLF